MKVKDTLIMFLAGVINAKVHLISGLIIGGLVVAASVQMKRNGRCLSNRCKSVQPNRDSDFENPIT